MHPPPGPALSGHPFTHPSATTHVSKHTASLRRPGSSASLRPRLPCCRVAVVGNNAQGWSLFSTVFPPIISKVLFEEAITRHDISDLLIRTVEPFIFKADISLWLHATDCDESPFDLHLNIGLNVGIFVPHCNDAWADEQMMQMKGAQLQLEELS